MLIAYLTISQSGMVLMGLAAGNETGVTGAAFQTVSGGLIVSLLWLVAGAVEERTGTAKLPELGGLARPMPFLSGAYIAGAFAMLGLPGLSGFIGSLFTMLGLMENMPGLAIAACVGFIPIAAALLRGATRAMYGPVSDRYSGVRDARLIEAVPVIVLLAFIVLLGCYPSIVTDMLLSGSADWDRSLLTAGIGG
jgi:NADH-quinone oxidoreductase subunit M